jgi:L-alanine-DL-glutamate epimerase-like enolase superfamily enzyme
MVSYDVPAEEVAQWAAGGLSLLKIKIGPDPGGRGDQEEMLQWDCSRLEQLHRAIADVQSPRGEPIRYYLDANGRYDSKGRIRRLLDHADRVGALGRILILEEPFTARFDQDVSDLPVRSAVDESYHSPQDVMDLLDLGYRCVALKPAAKTLTLALRALQAAHSRDVPCFVADLTVNPVLLEWNRNVAARLAPLPGMELGILEANGPQNYRDWDRLLSYHPHPGRPWIRLREACFELGEAFYQSDGDLFEQSLHYAMMVR